MGDRLKCRKCRQVKPVCCGSGRNDGEDNWCAECCPNRWTRFKLVAEDGHKFPHEIVITKEQFDRAKAYLGVY